MSSSNKNFEEFFKVSEERTITVKNVSNISSPEFNMHLPTMRIYSKYSKDIVDSNNNFLNFDNTPAIHYETFAILSLRKYLEFKNEINNNGNLLKYPYSSAITILVCDTLTEPFLNYLQWYVDNFYHNDITPKNSYLNHTDIQQLLQIKYAANYLLPLTIDYVNKMVDDLEKKGAIILLFELLVRKISEFNTGNTDLLSSKIFSFVKMIANNAIKDDADKDDCVCEVYNKILTHIIFRLEPVDTISDFITKTILNSFRFRMQSDKK